MLTLPHADDNAADNAAADDTAEVADDAAAAEVSAYLCDV
jgi:hypothetical protein